MLRRGRAARLLVMVAATSVLLGLQAQSARAELATATGGESLLQVQFETVIALQEKNIATYVTPPGVLDASILTAGFPITGGTFETTSLLGTVNHAGGLQIVKYNQDFTAVENTLETTNLRFVNGNMLVGDALGLIPSPSADLTNPQITQGPGGTVLFEADAIVNAVTALVLNTYFSTDAFQAGMKLGHFKSTIETRRYPRPGGGSPINVPLVPEFVACTAPNSEHVAPLARGSCAPPAQQSPLLTMSTNGQGGASAHLNVIPGNTSTAEDEADVAISASVDDVKRQSDGSDFVGRVALATTLRLTDRNSGMSGGLSGTTRDFQLAIPVTCVSTPDPSGSSCNASTSADAAMPGLAKEGERVVMSVASLTIKDPGPDLSLGFPCPPACSTGDESVFLRQGVFAP
jgi:hypothetical protein